MTNKEVINTKVKDYFASVRNAKIENTLIAELRELEEVEAFNIVINHIKTNSLVGLIFTNRVLNEHTYIIEIFKELFIDVDASGVKFILKYVIPKLGFIKVCYLIKSYIKSDFESFSKAMYWLPMYLPKNEMRSKKVLSGLKYLYKKENTMRKS